MIRLIKLCIFDLDGTLLDTVESIRFYMNKVLESRGINGISSEQTKVFVGEGVRVLSARALTAAGIDTASESGADLADTVADDFTCEYNVDPFYLTEPYPGIPEAVAELKRLGLKLAVLSNKPDSAVQPLIKRYFGDSFDFILGAGRFPRKPDPTSALFICESLGFAPSETAFFGDTMTDMQTANNYGAGKAVGVTWGFREKKELVDNGASVVIDSATDIPSSIL